MAFQRSAMHRALQQRSVDHARQFDVDAIDRAAIGNFGDGQFGRTLFSKQRPLALRLERWFLGQRDLRRLRRNLAIAQLALARLVGEHRVHRVNLARRHIPPRGCRRFQPLACAGPQLQGLEHAWLASRMPAEERQEAGVVDALLIQIAAVGGEDHADFRPIAVQFLGDVHRGLAQRAVAAFRGWHAHGDYVVGGNLDPCRELVARCRIRTPRQLRFAGQGCLSRYAQRHAAADDSCGDEEGPAVEDWHVHAATPAAR